MFFCWLLIKFKVEDPEKPASKRNTWSGGCWSSWSWCWYTYSHALVSPFLALADNFGKANKAQLADKRCCDQLTWGANASYSFVGRHRYDKMKKRGMMTVPLTLCSGRSISQALKPYWTSLDKLDSLTYSFSGHFWLKFTDGNYLLTCYYEISCLEINNSNVIPSQFLTPLQS